MDQLRIMAVCTGNICRSPMAQVVIQDRLSRAGLADQVAVDSTGISDEEHGNPTDPRAREVLKRHGYDSQAHRARQITRQEVTGADLVLPMTYRHYCWLVRLAGDQPHGQIRMYKEFDPAYIGLKPGDDLDLVDPWYSTDLAAFERALAEIEAGAGAIVDWARSQLSRRS